MNRLCFQIQEEKNPQNFEILLHGLNELITRKKSRFSGYQDFPVSQRTRPWRTVPALAKRIVKSTYPGQPERVEISLPGADELYREIRI